VQIYPISYHQDGAEVPTADFDDNRALFCKIAREYRGDYVCKICRTPLNTTPFFMTLMKFDKDLFAKCLKYMKRAKEKRETRWCAQTYFPENEGI